MNSFPRHGLATICTTPYITKIGTIPYIRPFSFAPPGKIVQVVLKPLTILWFALPNESQRSFAGTQALVRRVARERPDVLVLEWTGSNRVGLDLGRRIRRHFPEVRVVILGEAHAEPPSSPASSDELLTLLTAATNAGELAKALRGDVVRAVDSVRPTSRLARTSAGSAHITGTDPSLVLTAREREILPLAAAGITSAVIGRRLFISRRTVERHRANLMRKLGTSNQTELVCYALRRGILDLGETGFVAR